jgi:hypothetical protein
MQRFSSLAKFKMGRWPSHWVKFILIEEHSCFKRPSFGGFSNSEDRILPKVSDRKRVVDPSKNKSGWSIGNSKQSNEGF